MNRFHLLTLSDSYVAVLRGVVFIGWLSEVFSVHLFRLFDQARTAHATTRCSPLRQYSPHHIKL